jgi:F-type H+-transporting ATPase subunit b
MNVQGRLLLALAVLVSSPAAVVAQEHAAEGGGGLFDINPGLSIWTIVVFLLLVFVLGRYAWGPILAAVDAREQRIQDSLDQASKQSEEIKALVAEQRQHLAAARKEAQQIVAEGREAGERVRRDIEEKARSEGLALIEAARREIGREKEAALEEVRHESVELALAVASRLVSQKLDAEQDRQLAASYIETLQGRGDGAQA